MAECEGIPQCCDGTWFQYQPCCPAPEVSAGVDQEIEGLTGAFAGQANNYDSVLWTQISGPEVEITTPSSLTSAFEFSEEGTATFNLAATNVCGTSRDTVTVTSVPAPQSCCLYPWPGPQDARLYGSDDLPFTVQVTLPGPIVLVLDRDGYNFVGEEIILTPDGEEGFWQIQTEGSGSSNATCLISEYEGDFSASAEAFPIELRLANTEWEESIIMERVSNCRWEDIGPDNLLYGVQYIGFEWFVTVENAPNVPRTSPPEQGVPDGVYGDFTVSQV